VVGVAVAVGLVALAQVPAAHGLVIPPSTGTAVITVAANEPTGRQINEGLVGTNQSVLAAGPLIHRIGPDWARTDASLQASYDGRPVYDCATGAWDPVLLAEALAADRAEGGTPEVIVDDSPACLTTSVPSGTNPSYAPPDAGGWRPWDALVAQMARYAIGQGVRIFEVWNEPDWVFFDDDLPAYLALYRHTALVLEAAARRAGVHIEVGGPATLTADPLWIGALCQLASADHLPLDFVSWHDYANDPLVGPEVTTPLGVLPPPPPAGLPPYWYDPALDVGQVAAETDLVRYVLARTPTLHPLLVIDEWNLDAGYDPRMGQPYNAAFAAAVLETAQAAGVDRMAFFRVADSLRGNRYGDWGMLAVGPGGRLEPTPVYWTFRFWHELAGDELPATVTFGAGHGGGGTGPLGRAPAAVPGVLKVGPLPDITAVASTGQRTGAVTESRGRATSCRVLVTDFTPFDPTGVNGTVDPNAGDRAVSIELVGLAAGRYRVVRLVVDAENAGGPGPPPETVALGSAGRLTLRFVAAGDSASLVEVTRLDGRLAAGGGGRAR
jgi:hypothetical protein